MDTYFAFIFVCLGFNSFILFVMVNITVHGIRVIGLINYMAFNEFSKSFPPVILKFQNKNIFNDNSTLYDNSLRGFCI